MVKKDLERVGIAYETTAGIADFHALRHTFVTTLADSGVPPHLIKDDSRRGWRERHAALGVAAEFLRELRVRVGHREGGAREWRIGVENSACHELETPARQRTVFVCFPGI
jgi:hypothetical protein